MSSPAALETIRRIWVDQHCFEVGEWTEGPDMVELRTESKSNVEYFGAINLSMEPNTARLLAQALIETAADIERKKPA